MEGVARDLHDPTAAEIAPRGGEVQHMRDAAEPLKATHAPRVAYAFALAVDRLDAVERAANGRVLFSRLSATVTLDRLNRGLGLVEQLGALGFERFGALAGHRHGCGSAYGKT